MDKREKVIKGLECCLKDDCDNCSYYDPEVDHNCDYVGKCLRGNMYRDALALLKAQDIATIQPKRIELADETKAWLDEMDAVDALGNIADICIDWDGYRTANGLGGLINEIWAYARYCANKLLKAQEPVEPKKKSFLVSGPDDYTSTPAMTVCGACGAWLLTVTPRAKYCPQCGRAVKWE